MIGLEFIMNILYKLFLFADLCEKASSSSKSKMTLLTLLTPIFAIHGQTLINKHLEIDKKHNGRLIVNKTCH